MYAIHLISLGLQFNWSEHRPVKAEAAGSSPVSPDGSNKHSIHLSIFCEKEDKEQNFIPNGNPYFFFFAFSFRISYQTNTRISITSTSTDWWERDICGLVQLLVASYSEFQEIPYWVGLFRLFPIRVMESNTLCFLEAHTQMEFISCTLQNEFNIVTLIEYFSD